jgi:hypothetical protein
MPNDLPNQYSLGSLPGIEPQTRRVFQDLVDQLNFLTGEVIRLRERDLVVMPKGAARKENPIEGIIPLLSPDGADGFIRINKDGVIASYTNPARSIFPYVDISSKANVTTGLDPLHSFRLSAGSLGFNGDALWIRYEGLFAGNANSKRIRLSFGGQPIHDSGLQVQNGGGFNYDVLYVRLSPTIILAAGSLIWNFALSGAFTNCVVATITTSQTVADMNTNDMILLVEAEGTATDDITQTLSFINRYKRVTLVTI